MADGYSILTLSVLVLAGAATRVTTTTDDSDASSIQDNEEIHPNNDTTDISIGEGKEDIEFEQLFNLTTNVGASNLMAKKLSLIKRKMEDDIHRNSRKKNKVPSIIRDKTLRKVGALLYKSGKEMQKEQNKIEERLHSTQDVNASEVEIIKVQNTEHIYAPREHQKPKVKCEDTSKNIKKIAKIKKKDNYNDDSSGNSDETSFKPDWLYEIEKQRLTSQKLNDKLGVLDRYDKGYSEHKSYQKEHKCDDAYPHFYNSDSAKHFSNDYKYDSFSSDQSSWHDTQNEAKFKNNDYSSPVLILPSSYNDNSKKNNLNENVIKVKLNIEFEMPQKREQTITPTREPTYRHNPFSMNVIRPKEINSREPLYGRHYEYPRSRYLSRIHSMLNIPSAYKRLKMNNRLHQKENGATSSRYFDNSVKSNRSSHREMFHRFNSPFENPKIKQRPKLKFRNVFSRLILGKKNKANQVHHKNSRDDIMTFTTAETPVVLNFFNDRKRNDSKRDDIYKIVYKGSYYDNVAGKTLMNSTRNAVGSQNDSKYINESNANATLATAVLEKHTDAPDDVRNTHLIIKNNKQFNSVDVNNTLQNYKENETQLKLKDSEVAIKNVNVSINQFVTTGNKSNVIFDEGNITETIINNAIYNTNDTPNQIFTRKKRFIYQSQVDDIVHRSNVGEQKEIDEQKSKIQWMQSMVKHAGMYATGTLTYCRNFSCYSVRCGMKRCAQVDCMIYSYTTTPQLSSQILEGHKTIKEESMKYATPNEELVNGTTTKKPPKTKNIIRNHCSVLDYAELKSVPENSLPSTYIFEFMNNMQAFLADGLFGRMTVCRQGRCLTIDATNDMNTATFCHILNVDVEGHCYSRMR